MAREDTGRPRAVFAARAAKPLMALAFALMAGLASAAAPYEVDIWGDAIFDKEGKLLSVEIADAGAQPAAFIERVKQQLASARVPPAVDANGAPATLQTGIHVGYLITPAEGADGKASVRMTGVEMGPRPIKRYAASQPDNVPNDGKAKVRVLCKVGIDGRCGEVRVLEATAGSESLRRWAVASMRGWVFEPQRVNGQPVPAEVEQTLVLEIIDSAPKDFRDPLRL